MLLTSLLVVLSFYQNCGQAPENQDGNTGLSSNSGKAELPFAYKAQIDTLSYMSCSEMSLSGYEPRAYFTFRAGAYNNTTGGITPTQEFISATQYYSKDERGNSLNTSVYNSGAILSLSIRPINNYQQIWAVNGQVSAGKEVDSFLPPLDSAPIAGPLTSAVPGQMLNYFPGRESKRLMEASLRFYEFENVAQATRDSLGTNSSSYLVAGYTASTDILNQRLRSPVDVTPEFGGPAPLPGQSRVNSIFGTGFKLNFDYAAGRHAGDRRVLSTSAGIQEIDLQTNQPTGSTWACPSTFQFMVVRPEDVRAGRVVCNAGVDRYNVNDPNSLPSLMAIRRVLRGEDWWVDMDNHCVMPKDPNGDYCYGTTLGGRTIAYNYTSCTASNLNPTTSVCPHFVSVCVRQ